MARENLHDELNACKEFSSKEALLHTSVFECSIQVYMVSVFFSGECTVMCLGLKRIVN